MPNYVAGVGSFLAKLMIIGEAPGQKEDEQGIPFVGPAGEILSDALQSAGTSRSEVFITNVVKYRPPLNDFSKLHLIGVDLADSVRQLWDKEINKIRPNCILCIGDNALNAVTGFSGIRNYRGSILRSTDGMIKVVPTIHPAALFSHGSEPALPWVWKKIIYHDIQRAVEQSKFSRFSLPERSLHIARSSLDVYRFFQEYKSLSLAANDIESVNCIPVCSGFAFNKHHALSIPLIRKIGNHHLTDMSQREIIECWKLIQEAFSRLRLIGQNAKYDEYKQRLFGFTNINFVSDTLLKFHTIFPEAPEKGLAMISSLFTEEPYYKEEGKEIKIAGKSFDTEKFFIYNARDCAVEFECDEEMETNLIEMGRTYNIPLREFYYSYVMRAHSFFLEMENRGFCVDSSKKEELKARYEFLKESVHERLVEKVGYDFNVKSYPDMYKLLFTAMKFRAPRKEPTSEDTIIALMANQCKGKDADIKKQILEEILEERRIRDQLSRAINFTPDYDGRCKTSIKIVGTETSRRSTNILKKPVRPKKIGLSFHTIPKHGRLARDIRSMFVPDKGSVFIQGDLSQAEARIVAVLCKNYELLRAFDIIDIHRRTAGLFFGYTRELILTPGHIPIVDDLEKDGAERFTGKTFRHAGNYDMRKHTAMVNFNTNSQKYEVNTSISEWKAGKFIEMFHDADPSIRNVFHAEIRQALDNGRCLITPYGRPRIFHGKYDSDLYGEGYAQIPQSSVADTTLTSALAAWDDWGHDSAISFFVSENHDALVAQVPLNQWRKYAESLKTHMVRPIDFSTHCTLRRDFVLTIPVDIEVSIDGKTGEVTNYGALTKMSKVA
jgi:uracil-DNA glycosylase family 4